MVTHFSGYMVEVTVILTLQTKMRYVQTWLEAGTIIKRCIYMLSSLLYPHY